MCKEMSQTEFENTNKIAKELKKYFSPSRTSRIFKHVLTIINQMPNFSYFTVYDTKFVEEHLNLIVDGVHLYQSVIEYKNDSEDKIPTTSEMLVTPLADKFEKWLDRVKICKQHTTIETVMTYTLIPLRIPGNIVVKWNHLYENDDNKCSEDLFWAKSTTRDLDIDLGYYDGAQAFIVNIVSHKNDFWEPIKTFEHKNLFKAIEVMEKWMHEL